MMLGLGGLRNPLIIGQMMGATISAESHESDYGGLIPTPNHHGGYRRIGIDFATGFLARNRDGGDVTYERLFKRLRIGLERDP